MFQDYEKYGHLLKSYQSLESMAKFYMENGQLDAMRENVEDQIEVLSLLQEEVEAS